MDEILMSVFFTQLKSVTQMCPLQVELVYYLQVSWQGREAPPEVEHINSYQTQF